MGIKKVVKSNGASAKNEFRYESEIPTGAATKDILTTADLTKVHVELYLRAKGVKPWEKGGKIAYALSKNLQFGTDTEFDKLFTTY